MKKIILGFLFITAVCFSSLDISAQTVTKSRAGRNAAIGAGAGAVTGAVVSRNHKGKGAVIGAAVGASGGYAWGKHQDKKKGRRVVRKH